MKYNINFILGSLIIILIIICLGLHWNLTNQNHTYTWENQLLNLQTNGFSYPSNITKRFVYETSVCLSDPAKSKYTANFIEIPELDLIQTQDYMPFLEQINDGMEINQIARSFYNKSGDTLLIIPYPHQTLEYSTIKDFVDNAPNEIQSEFWKFVVEQIKQFISIHKKVYVSTSGFGVHYFHLRLCTYPKYYNEI